MSLPQPPEGILDPKQPWYPGKVGEKTWVILKAKLTGGEAFGTGYSSTVNLTSADADKLIENLKKDPRGYPQMDNGGGGRDFYDNLTAYQEWLREDYLEKPFNKERDAKIEEAAIESRMKEIDAERQKEKIKELEKQAKKDEESVPLPPIQEEEEQQQELDQSQEELVDKLDDLTGDIDSIDEDIEKDIEKKEEDKSKSSDKPENAAEPSRDLDEISESLSEIKGSLKIQAADLTTINSADSTSVAILESLKQLFQSQKDIIQNEVENAETKAEESSLEKTQDASGSAGATDTTADNKAEGIIQGVDGNILTVKPTEGEFKQGQKISQGGAAGGGLLGMLKGIAGKFMGGGKGGGGSASGGSPLKMSAGGFLNTSFPASMSSGGIAPGVYSKPTVGNLAPGQAVIPLNRNVGKKFLGGSEKNSRKFDQPLIDVMAQPLKAIGLSIITVAGNFIKALGPLGGFFLPYAKGLVKGFAAVLGVPATLIMSLLGGPAYAAMEDQEKQQNVFAKLWASLMDKFGFSSSDDEKKGKKKKKGKSGDDSGPENFNGSKNAEKAFNYFKSKGMTPEQSAGIVGNLIQESGVNPNSTNPSSGNTGIAQWDPVDRWGNLVNGKTFKGKEWKGVGESGSRNLENQLRYLYWEMDSGSGGLGLARYKQQTTLEGATELFLKDFERPGAHEEVLPKRITNAKGVIREYEKTSAESGIASSDSSMGKMLGWSIVKGPNSGYDVAPNLEMHGEEAYLEYETGISILPIENNKYSLSANPIKTLNRWKEILGPKNTINANNEYESGGNQVFDPGKYKGNAQSSRYISVGQGNNSKSYSIMYDREGASGTYTIKAISKKVSGNIISGDKLTSLNVDGAEGKSVLNSANVREYFKTIPGGGLRKGLKLELKPDKDAGIYYGYNQAFQTTKNAWMQKGLSQKEAEKYAAAAAKEFAITKKSGSWMPGSRNGLDPSLAEVEVASGNTPDSNASSENTDDPFENMKQSLKSMAVELSIMAAKPKTESEYKSLKSKFESAYNFTTPTAETAQNKPAAPQPTALPKQSTPTIIPAPAPASAAVTVQQELPFREQLSVWSEIYYA